MNVGISLAMSRRKIWTINILVLETMSQVRMSVFFQTVDSMSSKRLICASEMFTISEGAFILDIEMDLQFV